MPDQRGQDNGALGEGSSEQNQKQRPKWEQETPQEAAKTALMPKRGTLMGRSRKLWGGVHRFGLVAACQSTCLVLSPSHSQTAVHSKGLRQWAQGDR